MEERYWGEEEAKRLRKKWNVFFGFDIALFVLFLLNLFGEIGCILGGIISMLLGGVGAANSGGDFINEMLSYVLGVTGAVIIFIVALVIGLVLSFISIVLLVFMLNAIFNRKELKSLNMNKVFKLSLIAGIPSGLTLAIDIIGVAIFIVVSLLTSLILLFV